MPVDFSIQKYKKALTRMAGLAGAGASCVGLVVLVAFGRGVARVGEALHLAPLAAALRRTSGCTARRFQIMNEKGK